MRVPVPDDGAAAAPPNDVCGPVVDPDADVSNFGEKLETAVAAPPEELTLFAGMPVPRLVTAPPFRESPLRSRSIARSVITRYSSQRRGLTLWGRREAARPRNPGRAAPRSIPGVQPRGRSARRGRALCPRAR